MHASGRAQRPGSAGAALQFLAGLFQVKGDAGAEELGALCQLRAALGAQGLLEQNHTSGPWCVMLPPEKPHSQEMQEVRRPR